MSTPNYIKNENNIVVDLDKENVSYPSLDQNIDIVIKPDEQKVNQVSSNVPNSSNNSAQQNIQDPNQADSKNEEVLVSSNLTTLDESVGETLVNS